MSHINDAVQLAKTKLKTRRVRLTISVFVSSLLFCLLMAVSFTVHGAVNSIEKFRDSGLSHRYITQAYPYDSYTNYLSDPGLVKQAKVLEKKVQAKKQAEAKRLNLTYDPSTDQPFVSDYNSGPGSGSSDHQLNPSVPEVAGLLAKKAANSKGNLASLKKLAKGYGSTATYESFSYGNLGVTQPYLQVLKKGKEDFSQSASPQQFNDKGGPAGQFDEFGQQWQLMSPELMKPFILSGQNFKIGSDGSIPVIAPYSQAEKILGLKPLSASANSKARLERLKYVRTKAAGLKFNVCYRNQTSAEEVQNAVAQTQQIASDKNKDGFQMPTFVQGPPKKACGPVAVTRDVRSASDKQATANQEKFDQEFGKPKSASQLLKMRVVGLNADSDAGTGSFSVVEIFRSILQSSLGTGWFSPVAAADKYPALNEIFLTKGPLAPLANNYYYAEFANGDQAKAISDQQQCDPSVTSGNNYTFDPSICIKKGKYFSFNQFGSSSVAIDQFNKDFNKIFRIVALVMAAIAGLVLLGTVGRIIADSRRETAVFRAIGAKRRDIVQIYVLYTLMLAGLIIAASLIIGFLISSYINIKYSSSISVDALVAFNINDLNLKFSMTAFNLPNILYIAGLIIIASLLAAALPLLTNMRRNPIRDMRDER